MEAGVWAYMSPGVFLSHPSFHPIYPRKMATDAHDIGPHMPYNETYTRNYAISRKHSNRKLCYFIRWPEFCNSKSAGNLDIQVRKLYCDVQRTAYACVRACVDTISWFSQGRALHSLSNKANPPFLFPPQCDVLDWEKEHPLSPFTPSPFPSHSLNLTYFFFSLSFRKTKDESLSEHE